MRLAALGLLAGCNLGSSEPVQIEVRVGWPGADQAEVEASVSLPIEQAVQALPGVKRVLSVSRGASASVYAEVQGTDAVRAIQAISVAVNGLDQLPAEAEAPLVFQVQASQLWLKTEADPAEVHRAVGELARLGRGAAVAFQEEPDSVWELSPERLREHVVAPTQIVSAVDDALREGRWAGGQTPIREGVQLSMLGTEAGAGGHAYIDGRPAEGIRIRGGAGPDGWSRFEGGAHCVRRDGKPASSLLKKGQWVVEREVWWGRLPDEVASDPRVMTWPCAAPIQRVALVATRPDADLTRARSALEAWDGSLAVLPVPTLSREPKLDVRLRQQEAQALGVGPSALVEALQWSGGVRRGQAGGIAVELRWPNDPETIGRVSLVAPGGVMVPVLAVADLGITPARPARVRLDGRTAWVGDVALADAATLKAWSAPDGVEVVPLTGLGPEAAWR